MSTPDTAVQMTEKAAVGSLPPAVQQQLEFRKLQNQIAGKLAELNWGQKLDHTTRRAIADWGNRFRIDVTTEIHVLGGNIYLAAPFYLRRLGELIAEGLVEYAYADHVEDDPRLKQMGAEGEGEYSRRLRERIMHQIPDKAASAVVFRVKLRSMDREICGVKWCGNGTRKSDPVGDAFPVETSESRAARRAMRLLVSHVPKRMQEEILELEDGADVLTERIADQHKQIAVQELEAASHRQLMAAPAQQDPYGVSVTPTTQTKEPERVEVVAPDPAGGKIIDLMDALKTSLANAPTRADSDGTRGNAGSNPATIQQGSESANGRLPHTPAAPSMSNDEFFASLDESEPARPREYSKAEMFILPFGGESTKGKPLHELEDADLASALAWAKRNDKFPEFVAAAEQVLEDRRERREASNG